MRKSVEEILMERDNISKREARRIIKDCREAVLAAMDDGDDWEIDDIILDYLGFEVSDIDEIIY